MTLKLVIMCHMEDNGMKLEGRSHETSLQFSSPKILKPEKFNSTKHRSHADGAKCGRDN